MKRKPVGSSDITLILNINFISIVFIAARNLLLLSLQQLLDEIFNLIFFSVTEAME